MDEFFEEVAREQLEKAKAQDADPAYQAQLAAKRKAEIEKEIRMGVRDDNGDIIENESSDE